MTGAIKGQNRRQRLSRKREECVCGEASSRLLSRAQEWGIPRHSGDDPNLWPLHKTPAFALGHIGTKAHSRGRHAKWGGRFLEMRS
ncbi:hypothetical protein RRG08_035204 [Elysia crispata]|uniref:Uncharacterized protein n=1 Tax=Elysia crispata TaxID=231223 RepID=A0AAE0ZMG5_9GAST|nr:hypothetical protein RRG08_035204 [Elysia crispata]